MGQIMRRRLGFIAVIVLALLIVVIVVWRFKPIRNYVSESLSPNPQFILITQVYEGKETGIQSRILTKHQENKIKRLLYFLNSKYLVIPKDTPYSALIAPPIDYYITLKYGNLSEDQLVIVSVPGHSMENVKTGTIYEIAYSPDYGSYSMFINFMSTLFGNKTMIKKQP